MTASPVAPLAAQHDNRFDFLRLFAAWLVLLSHSFPLGGQPAREPLGSTLGLDTLGGVGVTIFFVLSGYLVSLSLLRSPSLWVFARRRVVRIYPALAVTCLLCVLVLGPVVTQLPLDVYFRERETWNYLKTATAFSIKFTLPGAFAGNPLANAINGSLWSLPYEIKCYVALAMLGLLPGSLRFKSLTAFGILLLSLLFRPTAPGLGLFDSFAGLDFYDSKLGLSFAVGAVFAAWKDTLRPSLWAGLALVLCAPFAPHAPLQVALWVVGLSVSVLWLALYGKWLPVIAQRWGDWSYGMYLYGFPVQQALAFAGGHQWGVGWFVALSTLLTLVLAGLSWHAIEKPAMRWK